MKTLVIAGLGFRGRLAYGHEMADTSDESLELTGDDMAYPAP
jgi:hypothetical protein